MVGAGTGVGVVVGRGVTQLLSHPPAHRNAYPHRGTGARVLTSVLTGRTSNRLRASGPSPMKKRGNVGLQSPPEQQLWDDPHENTIRNGTLNCRNPHVVSLWAVHALDRSNRGLPFGASSWQAGQGQA